MNPFKAYRLRPVLFFPLIAVLLIIFKIQMAWANSELFEAIKNSDIEKIEELIKGGADVHEKMFVRNTEVNGERFHLIGPAITIAAALETLKSLLYLFVMAATPMTLNILL